MNVPERYIMSDFEEVKPETKRNLKPARKRQKAKSLEAKQERFRKKKKQQIAKASRRKNRKS